MTETEKTLSRRIQGDLPLSQRPFRDLSAQLGMDERKVLEIIQKFKMNGIVRKFGAVLHHRRAGIRKNAMVLWSVPEKQCDTVGNIFSSFAEVTHCYERAPAFEGKYNLFTMVHFLNDGEDPISKLSAASGIYDLKILKSEEEFKKSAMEYF